MPGALAIAIPLVLAAVLIASGIAKLRAPDDLDGWRELGVPAALRKTWLLRLHPWGEIALGIALAVVGGWLGLIAAVGSAVLMIAYTVVIIRAVSRPEPTDCACFGARSRVTGVTVARNVWLTALALAAIAVIWTNPLVGGAVLAGMGEPAWVLALAIAAVTVLVVMWSDAAGEQSQDDAPADASAGVPTVGASDGEDDYVRTRIPAVPLELADGTAINLRTLAAQKPILLLAVSSTCGWCEPVVEQKDKWRALLPEVDVRLLLTETPDESRWTEREEPQSLHDVDANVRASIFEWATPTALLLGADGMLAGGPVTGHLAVADFVDDVYETLHGERPVHSTSPA